MRGCLTNLRFVLCIEIKKKPQNYADIHQTQKIKTTIGIERCGRKTSAKMFVSQ